MAVFCGVCAVRLSSAADNYCSFQVLSDFTGWDSNETKKPTIDNTCSECALALARAVTMVANKIADEHRPQVEARRAAAADERERQKQLDKDRADFEAAWWAERRAKSAT